jgi:hypothetical protein
MESADVATSAMRHAGRDLLSLALMDARNRTLRWLALFEDAYGPGPWDVPAGAACAAAVAGRAHRLVPGALGRAQRASPAWRRGGSQRAASRVGAAARRPVVRPGAGRSDRGGPAGRRDDAAVPRRHDGPHARAARGCRRGRHVAVRVPPRALSRGPARRDLCRAGAGAGPARHRGHGVDRGHRRGGAARTAALPGHALVARLRTRRLRLRPREVGARRCRCPSSTSMRNR